ncbi:MAG: lecithin retinol acyltransferase family protein [Chitinophagales bacterium]
MRKLRRRSSPMNRPSLRRRSALVIHPGDAIVVRSRKFALVNHYAVFLGKKRGQSFYMIYMQEGVKILTKEEAQEKYFIKYKVERIRRFPGSEKERRIAVQRALLRANENSYNFFFNNCEHFANDIQYSRSYSDQTRTFGASIALASVAIAGTSKNENTQALGVLGMGLGLLTLMYDRLNESYS